MFKGYLQFVGVFGKDGASIHYLQIMHGGSYKDDIDDYIKYNIIEKIGKNQYNEDVYQLTDLGKKLYRQEISIDDVLRSHENQN